ncbi:restriction endonuclease [Microbacterium maritypicum]|uniref:restriction endonuclease n=1 Tax=Microbacterium maritypicum TaxID=33918 RepID=UPI003D6FC219
MPTEVTTDSPLNISPSDPEWKVFEKDVANMVTRFDSGTTAITYDARLMGSNSGVERQVDVLVQGKLNGMPISIAVECKKYGRNIDVGDVDAFIGKLHDLDVDKGTFYIHNGASPGARMRAANARHPGVTLRENAGGELPDDWDEILPDCPANNCYGGNIRWTSSKQPAGGEDVEWGYCENCGTVSFRCRDCGSTESAEAGECFTCGAKYDLETTDYQTSDVSEIFQTHRGND